MIKIEIDAASGAEARAELLNLLGFSNAVTVSEEDLQISLKRHAKPAEADTTNEPEKPAEETTRKRRTKAEIEAEKKAAEDNEPDTSQAPPGPVDAEQAAKDKEALATGAALAENEVKHPELVDLQRVCAILVRAGYKNDGIKFIKEVGGADTSKDVPVEKRQACIDAMTKFAEDNKIAM